MIDLSTLPALDFTEKDAETITEDLIARYEETTGKTLYPADPVRLFLNPIAYKITLLRNAIDYSAKMNLLAFARAAHLDHLGAYLGVTRNAPQPAQTTLKFTLPVAVDEVVLVPRGTRVTDAGGTVTFETTEDLSIFEGETEGTVGAVCSDGGEAANGLAPGTLTRVVDPVAYAPDVTNITVTSGGADTEDDENLRERIQLVPESFSVAGPRGAYEYWARTANQSIVDVSVLSPYEEPGNVYVYPIMAGGVLPTEDILTQVNDILNDEKVRPLSDNVIVKAPTTVNYDIDLTYYIARDSAAGAKAIQDAVKAAVDDFELWQKSRIGRDINPSELIRRVMAAGALRVEVTAPEHTVLSLDQLAVRTAETEPTVSFGGLEDG